MKYIIRVNEQTKQKINETRKKADLNGIKFDEDGFCKAMLSNFCTKCFITVAECSSMKNSLSPENGLSA